jgi:hypothetical protein
MTAVGAASGTRAFLVSRHFSWVTPRRLRVVTIVLMAAALIASATLVSGSGPGSRAAAGGKDAGGRAALTVGRT